jgi:hypothetical protein
MDDITNVIEVPRIFIVAVMAWTGYMSLSMFDGLRDKRVHPKVKRSIAIVLFLNLVVTAWSMSFVF